MVRKRCKWDGCKTSPRCEHSWFFDLKYHGHRYRMPVDDFAITRGASGPVTSKQEAEKVWLPKFLAEIGAGQDPRQPRVLAPRTGPMSVAEFLDCYYERYVVAEQLKSRSSIASRLKVLTTRLGALPVTELARVDIIQDFKIAYSREVSLASVNRVLGVLRHAINWRRGRTPPILTTSPFHRYGVTIKTSGEVKRDRRISPAEEGRLLAAADRMDTAVHDFAGPLMRDRIIGALDTGCRLGEMLKIQNCHVAWDTHELLIPGKNAKDGRGAPHSV